MRGDGMKEIFEYIEQHHDAYLEELFTFLRCKSTNVPVEETIKAPNRIALKNFLFIIEKL